VDEDGYFGERAAARYDESTAEMSGAGVVEPAVDLLAELAGGGRALELDIGTGRIALPLAGRGVQVHGIDMSRAMVARLRAKPGGDVLGVTIGDFATTTAGGPFSVVYLVFNTIMNLTTQEAQLACFRNAAAHLEPGGCFVIEVGVPELRKLPPGQSVVPFHVGPERWAFDIYDTATQAMSSNYVQVSGDQGEYRSIPFRYVWPA
jgi:SAM-dependent methyltransferase